MTYLEKYTDDFKQLFELYQEEFNSHTNISAIRDREGVYEKHFQDALEFYDSLRNMAEEKADVISVIDIGTGGGFPTLPLALVAAREGLKVKFTALDSVAKKLKFVDLVNEKLALNNVETLHARAEEIAIAGEKWRESFDLALCRSVAYLNIVMELCVPLLKNNGFFVAFKQLGKTEMEDAQNIMKEFKLNLESEKVYGKEQEKQILVFQKKHSINKKYPRKYAQIKAKPI